MSGWQQQQHSGLTGNQFAYLKQNYANDGFVADKSRVDDYSDPSKNTGDRNWQDTLKKDANYTWTTADQVSYSKNSAKGPHNTPQYWDQKNYG